MNTMDQSKQTDMKRFVGKTLNGRYLLDAYRAEGGFGAVYQGRQFFLGKSFRNIAVKLSKYPGIDKKKASDLFNEIFNLSRLLQETNGWEACAYHVPVYDIDIAYECEERIYVVMDYIQGSSLREEFRVMQNMPLGMLTKWMCQVCQGMKSCHDLIPAIIHRDLKPENILIGKDGRIRIVDLGLSAKLVKYGYVPGIAGTPPYMAPETMLGESFPASDVYSIGIIMYEGLTGKHPFMDLIPPLDLPQSMHYSWIAKQKETLFPTPLRVWNSSVPEWLQQVVLKCLHPVPSLRYSNAGALYDALVQGENPPIEMPEQGILNKVWKYLKEGRFQETLATCREGLSNKLSSKETLFHLHYAKGKAELALKLYPEACGSLWKAWKMTEASVILREREERIQLLEQLAEAYRGQDNDFQAQKYKDMANKERGQR